MKDKERQRTERKCLKNTGYINAMRMTAACEIKTYALYGANLFFPASFKSDIFLHTWFVLPIDNIVPKNVIGIISANVHLNTFEAHQSVKFAMYWNAFRFKNKFFQIIRSLFGGFLYWTYYVPQSTTQHWSAAVLSTRKIGSFNWSFNTSLNLWDA